MNRTARKHIKGQTVTAVILLLWALSSFALADEQSLPPSAAEFAGRWYNKEYGFGFEIDSDLRGGTVFASQFPGITVGDRDMRFDHLPVVAGRPVPGSLFGDMKLNLRGYKRWLRVTVQLINGRLYLTGPHFPPLHNRPYGPSGIVFDRLGPEEEIPTYSAPAISAAITSAPSKTPGGSSRAETPPRTEGELDALRHSIAAIERTTRELPRYAYDVSTWRDDVVWGWMRGTSPLPGRQSQREYDQYYFAALAYRALALHSLHHAMVDVNLGNAASGRQSIADALRLLGQYRSAESAAQAIYDNDADRAYALAGQIYDNSKLAFTILSPVAKLGLVASLASDTLYIVLDYNVESAEFGGLAAKHDLAVNSIMTIALKYHKYPQLGNESIEQSINKGISKSIGASSLYKMLEEFTASPEVRQTLIRYAAGMSSGVADATVERTVAGMTKDFEQLDQDVTAR